MTTIELKEILIGARLESTRMRHYYLGIEHLFIAMLDIKGSLTATLISEANNKPEYVIDSIRQKVGKGSRNLLWPGITNTPRTEVVLGIADEIVKMRGTGSITERELLIAILEEGESIVIHVLKALNVDVQVLRDKAKTRNALRGATQTFTTIEPTPQFGAPLSSDESFILRKMFNGYAKLRLETRLQGGYSNSTLMVVTPVHADDREDASVVVKIGQHDAIYDEAQRYDRHVKGTLPPITARLEDTVITPQITDLAALKYTLITDSNGRASDVRAVVNTWDGERLARWLSEKLYASFGPKWWIQNRSYRFEAWQEYDWVLPPTLTLQLIKTDTKPEDAHSIRFPVKRANLSKLEHGEKVVIENFIVHRVDREHGSITLALGQSGGSTTRPYQIKVQGINFEEDTYFRNELVDMIVGSIWRTRNDELQDAARELDPDFALRTGVIKLGEISLYNPLVAYTILLDAPVIGSLSTIHGDLHMGNILIGENEIALLIDFGHTRDGHTLSDWATLEVSLLSELLSPYLDDTWASVQRLLPYLIRLNSNAKTSPAPDEIEARLRPIVRLRQIVYSCLERKNHWEEYYVGLALLALRAMTWETLSVPQRRLMFAVSALAVTEFRKRYNTNADSDEVTSYTDTEDTEYTQNTGL
jgi:hypothetical protein